MKFCTGRNCPIQYDPEKPFDFSKCEAFRDCSYATIVDTDSFNWIDILSLISITKRNVITDELQKLKEAMDKDIEKQAQMATEICSVSKPYIIQDSCSYCKTTNTSHEYKKDCYYYYEEQDMHAHIPCCSVSGEFEPKNCDEFCRNYISKKQANDLIKEHLATRKDGDK